MNNFFFFFNVFIYHSNLQLASRGPIYELHISFNDMLVQLKKKIMQIQLTRNGALIHAKVDKELR